MRRFKYRAKDRKTGNVVSGTVQAESEQTAGRILVDQGYVPQKIMAEDAGIFYRPDKMSAKQRIVFTRQLATLVGAGLPLSNSLRMIAEQTEDKGTKAIVEEITAQIEGGKTLHDAFAKFPEVFNKLYLSLIEAGEASGTLDISLERLAKQQEKDQNMMSKIRGALTYPIIVLVVIIAVVAFMMIAVVPQVEGLYRDLKKELPGVTQIMVNISNFFVNQWWVILLVVGFLVWFMYQFRRTDVGKKFLAEFKLNVPLFKELFLRLYNARFARTAQMLLSAGVPMLDSMKISGEAMNNMILEQQIDEAAVMVRGGKPLSVALKGRDYILPLVPQMAATGEESGRIDEMLGKAAQVYEDELDERLAAISTMIEPVLMVVLALVAGGMVAAILFPIYSIIGDIAV